MAKKGRKAAVSSSAEKEKKTVGKVTPTKVSKAKTKQNNKETIEVEVKDVKATKKNTKKAKETSVTPTKVKASKAQPKESKTKTTAKNEKADKPSKSSKKAAKEPKEPKVTKQAKEKAEKVEKASKKKATKATKEEAGKKASKAKETPPKNKRKTKSEPKTKSKRKKLETFVEDDVTENEDEQQLDSNNQEEFKDVHHHHHHHHHHQQQQQQQTQLQPQPQEAAEQTVIEHHHDQDDANDDDDSLPIGEIRPRSDSESSYQTANYHFENTFEKLQQETMAPAPFNINDSYLAASSVAPPLYSPPPSSGSVVSDQYSHSQAGVPSPSNNPLMLSPPQSNASAHSSSSQSSSGQDSAHDLPIELLNAGWRKYWSRREGRFYFFNKNSNQSVWEMPKLGYDPVRDPLGISHSANYHTPIAGNDPISPAVIPPNAFQPFVHVPKNIPIGDSGSDLKRNYIGPFDFDIESNVYTWEGFVFYFYHSHPEAELMRFNLVNKLRQQYYELCHSRQSLDAPKDSFTHWILERKTTDKGCDPFLPSECNTELSDTLYNEIMNDIPVKIYKPKFSGEARKQLSRYADAAKKIVENSQIAPQSRKTVKWNVEDAFEWIRRTLNATYEDYIERLEHLREQCQPHIIEASQASVKSICLKLYHTSIEYAKRIRDVNCDIFKRDDLRERGIIRFQNQKKVLCYPAYLVNPCPKLPLVQVFHDNSGTVRLLFKNSEHVKISRLYMQKLEMLYYFNCRDDRKYTVFPARVWCMLMRYYSFYNQKEGLFAQGSLPLTVFAALNKHFDVTFECFASPLNCYFRQYCSLFPDTDGYFGSRGSILNFFPITGSFQANPPDCEELIDVTITHFDKLLENSIEPLSFILFIHETPEMSTKIIPRLEGNKFKRTNVVIKAEEHEYRHGFQHLYHPFDSLTESPYNTLIYFLQNDAGFMKWGPMPERIEGLVESFKKDADREIVFSSPAVPPVPGESIRSNGHEN